jgi:aspartate aminotransferase-like enzyme
MDTMPKQLLFIPGPVTCAPVVLEAMAKPMIDHRGPEFAHLIARIETGMKPIFGTQGDVLVLGSSGTGGLEAAVSSAFSPGQKVLSCPVGVFGKRLAKIAATFGLDVEILETPLGSGVDPRALAARLRADAEHEIAGILLTHNETSTGVQNDMAALAAAIGTHPATVIVDSVSGLGASTFEMDAWKFDIVVTASQKALAVPPGAAMVAVSPRGWKRIEKATGPTFYLDLRKAREFAILGQTPWTPPVSIAYALDVAIDRHHDEGAASVYARHDRYARAIRAFAEAAGIELFSQPGAHSVTVVAMHVPPGLEVSAIRNALRDRYDVILGGGQAELKGKIFRMGTMGDLTSADVRYGLESLAAVLREHGYAAANAAALDAARSVLDERLVTAG